MKILCFTKYELLINSINGSLTQLVGQLIFAIVSVGLIVASLMNEKNCKEEICTFIKNKNSKIFCFCLIVSISIITICSKSSFLYPLNDWVDSNCFFTVGKGMMNGKVPYRDLLEQKGPLLYFIHGIAWLISNDSFLGVYFFETIAASIFLYYSFRTFALLSNKEILIIVPIIALVTFSSGAFCHGDSAEEFCLPMLAFATWVIMKSMKTQKDLMPKDYVTIGILAGCVFWIKFTLVGFFVGWFILPAIQMIRNERWKQFWCAVGNITLGVVIITVPFVIYFGAHGAVSDWLQVYIYNNIFGYSAKASGLIESNFIYNLVFGMGNIYRHNIVSLFMIMYGLCFALLKKYRKIALQIGWMFLGLLVFVYVGGRIYPYYSLIFSVFLPFGMAMICRILGNYFESIINLLNHKFVYKISCVAIVLMALTLSSNNYLLGESKDNMPQYQFKKIIEQEENPTVLNCGFLDGGFYTVCEIIPKEKAFCEVNNPALKTKELQQQYVKEGQFDFVITRDYSLESPNYKLVAESSYYFEREIHSYYLYKLVVSHQL